MSADANVSFFLRPLFVYSLVSLVRTASPDKTGVYTLEIFGNFLLIDQKTGTLSTSHGYRSVSDVASVGGFRDRSDFSVDVSTNDHIKDLSKGLLDGRYLRHFEGIFQDSARSIVRLLQVVVCCDKLNLTTKWIAKEKPAASSRQKGKR